MTRPRTGFSALKSVLERYRAALSTFELTNGREKCKWPVFRSLRTPEEVSRVSECYDRIEGAKTHISHAPLGSKA